MHVNNTPHGWKTYLAAAAAILAGAVALVNGHYAEGLGGIVAGLALIGVRGAVAKVIETLQQLLEVTAHKEK